MNKFKKCFKKVGYWKEGSTTKVNFLSDEQVNNLFRSFLPLDFKIKKGSSNMWVSKY